MNTAEAIQELYAVCTKVRAQVTDLHPGASKETIDQATNTIVSNALGIPIGSPAKTKGFVSPDLMAGLADHCRRVPFKPYQNTQIWMAVYD